MLIDVDYNEQPIIYILFLELARNRGTKLLYVASSIAILDEWFEKNDYATFADENEDLIMGIHNRMSYRKKNGDEYKIVVTNLHTDYID